MTTKLQQKERDEAIAFLREVIKPGDTVYTILRHVSRSGMMRHISALISRPEGGIWDVSYQVAQALGWPRNHVNNGIKCGGCGMDMGFHLVYSLGHALWPDGFDCADSKGCPSNDHVNYANHTPSHHKDGGYAIRQAWL